MTEPMTKQDLKISKSAQVAAKWWTDRMDGTIKPMSNLLRDIEEFKAEAEESGNEIWIKLAEIVHQAAVHAAEEVQSEPNQTISQEQSKNLRHYIEILVQEGLDERGYEWLGTNEERACTNLGYACLLSGVDHENLLTLPLNVTMCIRPDKVEVEFEDFMRSETIYDARQEKLLQGRSL